jgi:hypothetical protein
MRTVRAVSDKDSKYAGFDFAGKRRIVGEVFEWPNGRGMPEVVRDADGLIVSGWVELVSGEDEAVPAVAPKGRKKGSVPGLVEGKEPARHAKGPGDLVASGRASDRRIG